ncbi:MULTISPECIES: hypothetical protein [unclassified Rhizobium]|uniref:hypothetical protein n=1 Tax=unclassified Rhizobium TaxID=2613769 RepID=UPI001ADC9036|nr:MULTISPECIES: hypothetical protein [unclassified Rhizobium]MBO9172001.1 hypothetical protein [Rhizobium sp. L245/93]QXZ87716.1 hypothetical protein J5287_27325 [Rhizobium sp. K1/93]QXZ93756.1 hypothetical protein J5280_27325 [Rhizobium sp. K15/93]
MSSTAIEAYFVADSTIIAEVAAAANAFNRVDELAAWAPGFLRGELSRGSIYPVSLSC